MTIDEINGLTHEDFIQRVGWVCEYSPWVSERAWKSRPFDSLSALHSALVHEITGASEDEKLSLLKAHPDLGTKAKIAEASRNEQASAGLDQLTPEEFTELRSLNEAYKQCFGFPFLFAVKGSNKHEILASLRFRIHRTREMEFDEALGQIANIIRFRLETIVDNQEQ